MKAKLAILTALVVLLGAGSTLATAQAKVPRTPYDVAERAVCYYFKTYCSQAMRVVACETGNTFSKWANNGQYLGIFQMGSHERKTYGHGNNVWAQAKAAYRYFQLSGYDWSPWTCKP